MLKLCEAHTPQIKNLVNWLYTKRPDLVTSKGDVLKSEEGGQQGDGLTNILFGLLQRYIDSKVDFEGLRVKKYFWDDSVYTGTSFAVISALLKIRSMQSEIGLPVRLSKIHFHCPTPEIALECARQLAESGIPIKKPASDGEEGVDGVQVHGSMDQTWMKVPIGSSGYVQGCLKKKLAELSALVEMISNMPARHEAFSILRSCASSCKIHLTRTVPPKDSIPFVEMFDSILRKGSESIVG